MTVRHGWFALALAALAVPVWYVVHIDVDQAEPQSWTADPHRTIKPLGPAYRPSDDLTSPSMLERLPRFSHARASGRVTTSVVRTRSSLQHDFYGMTAPMAAPVIYDRKTVTSRLAFYWRSEEADDVVNENTAALLDETARTLQDYLKPADTESNTAVYFKRRDAGGWSYGKSELQGVMVWRAVFVDTYKGNMIPVAVHELSHYYTPRVDQCYRHPALCEGLAVMLASDYAGDLGMLHQSAAWLLEERDCLGFAEVRADEFYQQNGLDCRYQLSGSFVTFLVGTYGVRPVLDVIAGASFSAAFGRPLADLDAEWRTHFIRVRSG